MNKLEARHYKYLKRASTLFKITKHFPTENHRKLYTHRMAELFLESLEIGFKKGIKFTLFSGDEKNLLAWAVGLNLTSFECLSKKFMDYYSSSENPAIQNPNCLSGVEYASNLLVELFHQDSGLFVNLRYNGKALNICDEEGKPDTAV